MKTKWFNGWADFLYFLGFAVGLLFIIVMVGTMLYGLCRSLLSPPPGRKPGDCYIEAAYGDRFSLRRYERWGTDEVIGRFGTFDEAMKAGNELHCLRTTTTEESNGK